MPAFFNSVQIGCCPSFHYSISVFAVVSNLVVCCLHLSSSLVAPFFVIVLLTGIAKIVLLFLFRNADPGFVAPSLDPRPIEEIIAPTPMPAAEYYTITRDVDGEEQIFCRHCKIWREKGVNHCITCNRCCQRFDHHCGVLGGCVGLGTHRFFIGYLACLLVHGIFGLTATVLCLIDIKDANWGPAGRLVYLITIAILYVVCIYGGFVCVPYIFMAFANRTVKNIFGRKRNAVSDSEQDKFVRREVEFGVVVQQTCSDSCGCGGWEAICCADFAWKE